LALARAREDRRSAVRIGLASRFAARLWRLWLLLIEARIHIWQRLPRFYHLDQKSLDLAEPHLIEALQEACSRESHRVISLWTADSLEAYCDRSERDHAAAMQQAADCGRRWMLHREALAEIMTAGPRNAGDGGLVRAARYVYATGQLRRQYDHLWHEKLDFAQLSAEHFEPEPSGLAINGTEPSSAANGSSHTIGETNQRPPPIPQMAMPGARRCSRPFGSDLAIRTPTAPTAQRILLRRSPTRPFRTIFCSALKTID
jgi:hypothetical protein